VLLTRALEKATAGERLTADEALALYTDAPTHVLGKCADRVRARRHPSGQVTYIIDRNVNYTNICVARCTFCAFYRPVGSSEGYVLAFDEILRKIEETISLGGGQLLLQGGHNPDVPLAWYGISSDPSRHGIRRSGCTRSRRPKSSTSPGWRSCPCRR